jgi:hypothetical protein
VIALVTLLGAAGLRLLVHQATSTPQYRLLGAWRLQASNGQPVPGSDARLAFGLFGHVGGNVWGGQTLWRGTWRGRYRYLDPQTIKLESREGEWTVRVAVDGEALTLTNSPRNGITEWRRLP